VAGDSAAAVSGLPTGVTVYLNARTKIGCEASRRLPMGIDQIRCSGGATLPRASQSRPRQSNSARTCSGTGWSPFGEADPLLLRRGPPRQP
jgi:hypothetical protein